MKYARNDLTRLKVIEVYVETPEYPISSVFPQVLVDEFIPCPDNVEPEWDFNPSTNTYSEPPPPPPGNVVEIDCPTGAPKGTPFDITATIKVDDGSGTVVPYTGIYYVPISNLTDGVTNQMLVFSFVNGVATTSVTLDVVGLYDVLESQIRPVPTARMAQTVNISIY